MRIYLIITLTQLSTHQFKKFSKEATELIFPKLHTSSPLFLALPASILTNTKQELILQRQWDFKDIQSKLVEKYGRREIGVRLKYS